jgi:hypothetical protein
MSTPRSPPLRPSLAPLTSPSHRREWPGARLRWSRAARSRFAPGVSLLEDRTHLSLQPTVTAIASSAGSLAYGQTVNLTASVSDLISGTDVPTGGTVTFRDGGTVVGTGPLVDGVATLADVVPGPGRHMFTASYNGDGFSGFSYVPATLEATWTLPTALGIDRLMLALDDDLGASVDSTIGVYGPTSANFSVLPGDFDGNGVVTIQDANAILNLTALGTSYDPWADLDGSGTVDINDYLAVRRRIGWKLP